MGWTSYWDNLSSHESEIRNRLGATSHSELLSAIREILDVAPIWIDNDKISRISTEVIVSKNVLKIRTEMAAQGRRVAHYSALAMSAAGFAVAALPFIILLENSNNIPVSLGLMATFLAGIYFATKHSYYRGVLEQNYKVREFLEQLNNKAS